MSAPGEPRVLEYHRPSQKRRFPHPMILLGPLPFLVEVAAMFWEARTGDPPNDLGEFQAYHYITASAVLFAIAWVLWIAWKYRGSHRWLVLFCSVAWCAWVYWVGYWFLRELHRHPAGQYYWSMWWQ